MADDTKRTPTPKRRFPRFIGKPWESTPLSRLAKRVTERNSDGKITRVLTNSAERGILDQREYFDKDIANAGNLDGYYVVKRGDYVYNPRISTAAPVGPISRNNLGTGIMSPLYTVFRFESEQTNFHEFFFKSACWHSYLRSISSTGARHDRMSIAIGEFMKMPVPNPSPLEQERIANCLTLLNEAIVTQRQKVDVLDAYKQGLTQRLFPSEGEATPRLRFPIFCDTPVWDVKALEAVCELKAGEFVPAPEISELFSNGLFPCYGGNGLRGYVRTSTHEGRYSLIGRQGALCGNVNLCAGKFHATEHALVATPKSGIDTDWLFYALGHLKLNRFATGQAQPGLSVGVLQSVSVAVPINEQEQREITGVLSSLDRLTTIEVQKLAALKRHKKGLMQDLFSSSEGVDA